MNGAPFLSILKFDTTVKLTYPQLAAAGLGGCVDTLLPLWGIGIPSALLDDENLSSPRHYPDVGILVHQRPFTHVEITRLQRYFLWLSSCSLTR